MQAEGEEGGFDDENKGFLGCEARKESVGMVERTRLVWSRENDRPTKMFTPKGMVREIESFFASHPVGRMMASFGGRVDDLPKSRDGSSPRFERLSKSDSVKGLRSEITISNNDVRKYSRMLWLKDE
ncbi:hypothetical protein VNO80_07705 [Phaseolus coccineus]|uniref:Uncharacterized protein n=1 Tax=Phaseolus coccineus TaxID=3886 RepID=A0AAN9NK60_PHACN